MKNRLKKIIITTGALLCLTVAPISQANPLGAYMNEMSGVITAHAAEQVSTFSGYWYQSEDGAWHIRDGNGNIIKNAWICDDAVTSNGQNVWYLVDANGNMVSHGLVKDQTGNIYSLETNHNGYYGMLRYQSGTYDGVYLDIEQSHSGAFGNIKNADGVSALQSRYGLSVIDINNSNIYYTSTFNGGAGQSGGTTAKDNGTTADGLTDLSSGAQRIPLAPTDKSPIGTQRDGYTLYWSGCSDEAPYWDKDAVEVEPGSLGNMIWQ